MSKPIPGKPYTVKRGDTVSSLASQAYGDSALATRIEKANPMVINFDSLQPGMVLNIPFIFERNTLKSAQTKAFLSGKGSEQLTLMLDGNEVPVLAASVLRTMDTVTDGWAATLQWVPGKDPAIDAVIFPFAYPEAAVYLGGELVINGVLYDVETSLVSGSGQQAAIRGYSFTADIVDSIVFPPYEVNKVTLEQRAVDLLSPIGITAIFEKDFGGTFDRITAKPTETIFRHLVSLATQRGFLLSSTANGDLLFVDVNTTGASVGSLSENDVGVSEWRARFDGRKRFNTYKAIGQSPKSNSITATVTDEKVPRSRFLTIKTEDTTAGNVRKAAEWRRSKQLAEALSISLPVSSWYAPNGDLWTPNTLVTVVSETMFIPKGFTFLIKSVEYSYGTDYGAVLSLVPPQVYTSEVIKEPW